MIDPAKRYELNPFIEDMELKTKKRPIRVSPLGANTSIVNNDTGEITGTHVVTYKKVDSEQFLKLFTKNVALTFDLNAAGIKAFNVLVWAVQNNAYNSIEVGLDKFTLSDFLKSNESLYFSQPTFTRGLNDLCKSGIIAKSRKAGYYHINPNFIFNGDRIAFTTLIERENSLPSNRCSKTKDWISD